MAKVLIAFLFASYLNKFSVFAQQISVGFKVGVALSNVTSCTDAGNNFLLNYFNSYIPLYGRSYFKSKDFVLDKNVSLNLSVKFDPLAFTDYPSYLRNKIENATRSVLSLDKMTASPTMGSTSKPPTPSPIRVPTSSPTRVPTSRPIRVPTPRPSAAPTKQPTTAVLKRILVEKKERHDSIHAPEGNEVYINRRLPSITFIWSGTTAYTCRMCNPNAYDARRLNVKHHRRNQAIIAFIISTFEQFISLTLTGLLVTKVKEVSIGCPGANENLRVVFELLLL
jgi:hypothetical protein